MSTPIRIDTEVAIVGGGIVGGSAALFLRRRGIAVTLLDADACGAKASGVNYGGVRRQGRAPDQMPLTQRAHQLWADLPALIGIDGEYVKSGHLKLARSPEDMAALERYQALTRDFGLDLELIDGTAFRARYPWLGQAAIGGSLCPQDGHANPRLVSPAFARAAEALGARVLEHHAVTRIEHHSDGFILHAADKVVHAKVLLNCAGAWGGRIAADLGEPVPETAIFPLMMVTEPLPYVAGPSLGVQGGGIYARQVVRGNFVIGGGRGVANAGSEVGNQYARPARAAIGTLLREAAAVIPALAHAHVIRFWSGVEGNFADHNPVLGPSGRIPGLFHAFGFSGAGFQIGPAVGELLASLVATGHTEIPIHTFLIDRFASTRHADADEVRPNEPDAALTRPLRDASRLAG